MATDTITTPSGGTVELVQIHTLNGRKQLDYLTDRYDTLVDLPSRGDDLDAIVIRSIIYRHVIVSWSYTQDDGTPLPLPTKDNDTTLELLDTDLRAIWEAIKDTVGYLSPSYEPPADPSDPKAVEGTSA